MYMYVYLLIALIKYIHICTCLEYIHPCNYMVYRQEMVKVAPRQNQPRSPFSLLKKGNQGGGV